MEKLWFRVVFSRISLKCFEKWWLRVSFVSFSCLIVCCTSKVNAKSALQLFLQHKWEVFVAGCHNSLISFCNLVVKAEVIPSYIHHFCLTLIMCHILGHKSYPFLARWENRYIMLDAKIPCILVFRWRKVNFLPLQDQKNVFPCNDLITPTKVVQEYALCFICTNPCILIVWPNLSMHTYRLLGCCFLWTMFEGGITWIFCHNWQDQQP